MRPPTGGCGPGQAARSPDDYPTPMTSCDIIKIGIKINMMRLMLHMDVLITISKPSAVSFNNI